jgi:hypothetical protein
MTLAEILGILAVTVAIDVGFLIFFDMRERGKGMRVKKASRDAGNALMYVRQATTETVESLQTLDIKVKDLQNQLYRILESSSIHETTREKIVQLLHRKDLRLDKTLQELSLFSHNPVVRFSACKRLAMNCGDAASLEKLVLVAEHESDAVLKDQYRPYIEALKVRIDSGLRA